MATRKPTQAADDQSNGFQGETNQSLVNDEKMTSGLTSTNPVFISETPLATLSVSQRTAYAAEDKSDAIQSTSDTNNYEKDIQTLVENLRRDNYLPVIFVGAAGSGKTQVFTSLIKFFRSADDFRNPNSVNVTFGKPLVSVTTYYGKNQRDSSERHFRKVIDDALRGTADESTRIDHPLAIPVRLSAQINGQLIEQNFAFFEAHGEWFEANKQATNKDYYPQLKPEIIRIFRGFDEDMGVAIIYTAPCDVRSNESELLENQNYLERLFTADQALQVGLTRYMETRVRKDKDKHIFLLTKWDAVNKIKGFADKLDLTALDPHTALSLSPDDSMRHANAVANKLYPGSYALFKSAALVTAQQQRVFLPYSSGIFSGRYIENANESAKFDRYIKSVWNELMFAAGHTKPLFPSPPTVNLPWWKKFLNHLG